MPNQGELTFTLTERRDRNNDLYLFGSIRFINSVLFVRPDPENPGQWTATLKPYRPKNGDEAEFPWTDDQPNKGKKK